MDRTRDAGMTAGTRFSLVAIFCAMAMVVLDAGMLNVALPRLSSAIDADLAHSIWAVSAYQMALLVGLLPSAQLAERFGQKAVFVGGLACYLLASVGSAASSSLAMLVGSRIVQGLGGAVIMALGMAILRIQLGPDRLGRAIGWNALVVAIASAAAPSLAAAILSMADWPWLFLAKIPLGLAALAASTGIKSVAPTRSRVDATAIALHAAIALAVVLAFEQLPGKPLLGLTAFVAVIALTRWMVSRPAIDGAPLWPRDLLAGPAFRTSVMASVACFTGQSAGLIALPILLQAEPGVPLADTALVMTCWPLAVALTAPLSGKVADRVSAPLHCAVGAAILSSGLFIAALTSATGDTSRFALSTIICGIGFGLFQIPNNRTLFLEAPTHRAAAAGGMQGSARLLGQTLGSLLVGMLLAQLPAAQASRMALIVGGLCALAAALISLGERRSLALIRRT